MPIAALIALALASGPEAGPEDLVVELLQRYLRIDTTNPPGNELRGALFYREVLEHEGIAVELASSLPDAPTCWPRCPEAAPGARSCS
jgi:hypothetical protein